MESVDINKITKKLFIKNLDTINSEILKMIEYSYIKYYGINSKSKISDIFNKLKLIYFSDNVNVDDLNNRIEKLENILQEKIDRFRQETDKFKNSTYEEILNYIINNCDLLQDNMTEIKKILIQLGFNYMLVDNKKNNTDKKVILYHNNNCENNYCVYDDYIEKNCESNGAAIINIEEPIAYIQINNDGIIMLQGIIHEVGHLIMKEALFIDENGDVQFASGIYDFDIKENKDKIINEIINEYISEEILSDIINKCNVNNYLLSPAFGSWYVEIDIMNNNLIKSVYNLLKDEIKNNVINGNHLIIKRIINNSFPKTFDNINKHYYELLMSLINRKKIESKTREEIIEEVKETQRISNLIINQKNYYDIYNGYKKYLIDIQKEKEYVDDLVNKGRATRI